MRTTEIINPGRNISLKASAGSGKTFALSLRVVNLLLNGIDPDRILCITFTNKATNEMYQRVISLIRFLAFGLSPSTMNEEAKYLLLAARGEEAIGDLSVYSFSDGEVHELRRRSGDLYEIVVRNISRLRISTIDSFLNTILRLFPFEAGVMPDFKILTPNMHERLYLDSFDHFIRSLETGPLLRNLVADLIKMSCRAVNSPATFLRDYFDRLLDMRVGAERVIRDMVTCVGEGKGGECIEDISARLRLASDLDISLRKEARAFARRLRETCPEISERGMGQIEKYETCGAGDIACLTSIEKDSCYEYQYFRKCPKDAKALAIFATIKRDLPQFIHLRNRVYRDAILYLFSLFTVDLDRMKRAERGLTFSDITDTCYRLLVDRGMVGQSSDYFYFRLDSRIDHLLIDEFQDTNLIQWLILKPFVDELTAGIGQHDRQGSFFYVGDPKQSIYRFRGGESRLFDTVLEQYRGKIAPQTLGMNYRSSREVVGFVNTLFSGISDRYLFDYEPQECRRDESGGYVEVLFLDRETAKENPEVKEEKVLAWIEDLAERGIGPRDIAILCCENRECEEYAEFLKLRDIPVVTEGSLSFLSSSGVDGVIELLKYLNDPGQTVYLLNFLFSVPGLLTERQKRSLLSQGSGRALPDHIREKIEAILNRVNLLPIANIIRMIVDEFRLAAHFEGDPNITLLIDMASSPELEDPVSLGVFLAFVETTLRDVKAVQAESVHAVKILTIHKAKGLEFPFVIVPELEIPISVNANRTQLIFEYGNDLSIGNIYLNENEKILRFHEELSHAVGRERELVLRDRLNLLYVAMTRAKEGLFVVAVAEERCDREHTLKLSDILFEVLGEGGYRAGEVAPGQPQPAPGAGVREKPAARLDDILSFIEGKREEIYSPGEREETVETRSFENFRARRVGVALHYAVQMMRGFEGKHVDEAFGRVKELFGGELSPGHLDSIHSRLERLVTDTRFLALVDGMERSHEITLIQGKRVSVADLLLIGKGEVRIIDFKTSDEEDLRERYVRQVRGYCSLASQIFGLPGKGYLCFVLDDEIRYQEVS